MPIIVAGNVISSANQVNTGVITTGGILNGTIKNEDVDAAAAIERTKLANVSTTSRVIGRKTAGAGADEELTLSEILDFISSATKGDLLVRDAATWARLPASTAGYYLMANGAGELPTYQAFAGVTYKNGTTTKNAADASTTQNIAHGLGVIPKKIRITAQGEKIDYGNAGLMLLEANTAYNGTTQSSVSTYMAGNTNATVVATFSLNTDYAGGTQTGVVTFDATNIIVTWTKTGSPTGTYTLMWEAEA